MIPTSILAKNLGSLNVVLGGHERERESAFIGGYANGTWVATAPAVSTSTAAPGEIAHPPPAKKKEREKKEAKQHYSRVGEKGETRDTDMHTESQLTDRERDRPLLLIAAKGRTGGRKGGTGATATTVFRISSSTPS